MKKVFCSLLSAMMLLSAAIPGFAANIGDVAGEVVYTDIATYINHYPISAYAYDGGMVVVAEDLRNYGFEITYDDGSRSLSILPNKDMSTLTGMGTIYKNGNRLGKHFADALYSDINVYLNGSWIPSCAINGYMMVKLEDLANEAIGTSFTWDDSTRSAKLWIDWAGITQYKALMEDTRVQDAIMSKINAIDRQLDIDINNSGGVTLNMRKAISKATESLKALLEQNGYSVPYISVSNDIGGSLGRMAEAYEYYEKLKEYTINVLCK